MTTSQHHVALQLQMGLDYRHVATGIIIFGFLSLGLLIASLGPSLLGLERQTGASAETLSYVFTARSCGYLLGSVVGGVLLDWYPERGNGIISVSLALTSVSTALIPFATVVGALAALVSTQGFAMGFLDTIGNVLLLNVHGDDAGPWMQGLHAIFAVGTLLSPLIIRASMDSSASETSLEGAYYVFASFAFIGSCLFACVPTPPPRAKSTFAALDTELPPSLARSKQIIALTALLIGMYVGAETGYGGFLILFATNGTWQMTEAEGQYLTAVYWGSLAVGRVIAIPLSLKFKPSTQLLGDLFLCLTGVCLLLMGLAVATNSISDSEGFLWAGSAVYGLGMASVFPSAFMLAESLVDLTGRVASVIMVGSATGEMVVPLVLGLVTESWAPGFVVIILIVTLSFAVPSVVLYLHSSSTRKVAKGEDATGFDVLEKDAELATMNPIGRSDTIMD